MIQKTYETEWERGTIDINGYERIKEKEEGCRRVVEGGCRRSKVGRMKVY